MNDRAVWALAFAAALRADDPLVRELVAELDRAHRELRESRAAHRATLDRHIAVLRRLALLELAVALPQGPIQ